MNRCRMLFVAFVLAFCCFFSPATMFAETPAEILELSAMREMNVVVDFVKNAGVNTVVHSATLEGKDAKASASASMALDSNTKSSSQECEHKFVVVAAFDLDQVVMEPATRVGSDPWFSLVRQRAESKLTRKSDFLRYLLPPIWELYGIVRMQFVEESVADVIDGLKKAGAIVIGVTSRSMPLIPWTLEQLSSLHTSSGARAIKFTSLWSGTHNFETKNPTCMRGGIGFCGEESKGNVVESFLKDAGLVPDLLVSIDDRKHHLDSVKTMAIEHQIPYIGLRYNFCDDAEKAYKAQGLDVASCAWVDEACTAINAGQDATSEYLAQLTAKCKKLVALEEARLAERVQMAAVECSVS